MITNLTKKEFEALQNVTLIFQEERSVNRGFAMLSDGDIYFKFSWQSDIVKPVIIDISPKVCAIGVDLHVAIVDFTKNEVRLNMELDNLFCSFYKISEVLLIITELQVIVLNSQTFQVVSQFDLPDVFSSLSENIYTIDFHCLDGSMISIENNS